MRKVQYSDSMIYTVQQVIYITQIHKEQILKHRFEQLDLCSRCFPTNRADSHITHSCSSLCLREFCIAFRVLWPAPKYNPTPYKNTHCTTIAINTVYTLQPMSKNFRIWWIFIGEIQSLPPQNHMSVQPFTDCLFVNTKQWILKYEKYLNFSLPRKCNFWARGFDSENGEDFQNIVIFQRKDTLTVMFIKECSVKTSLLTKFISKSMKSFQNLWNHNNYFVEAVTNSYF